MHKGDETQLYVAGRQGGRETAPWWTLCAIIQVCPEVLPELFLADWTGFQVCVGREVLW